MEISQPNPLLSQSFLVPSALIKLISFVSFDVSPEETAENIIFSNSPTHGYHALCCDVSNNKFILKFISNHADKTPEFLASFFEKKGQALVKSGTVAAIKTSLAKDLEIKKQVGEWVLKNDIDNSDWEQIGQYQQELISAKAEKMALNDKTIKSGSVFRAPLSTNSFQSIHFQGQQLPMLESRCILVSIDEKTNDVSPSASGIYYASQNRHSIPLTLSKHKKDDSFRIILNSDIVSKEQTMTLLNHSIRTAKTTGGFSLFFTTSRNATQELMRLSDQCNTAAKHLSSATPESSYDEAITNMINYLSEVDDFNKVITMLQVFLPINASFKKVLFDSESLISALPKNITNISLSQEWNTSEEKDLLIKSIQAKIYEQVMNKEMKFYCFYNIHASHNDIESTTYGFIENNINSHSIMPSLLDTISITNLFKTTLKESKTASNEKNIPFDEDTQELIF